MASLQEVRTRIASVNSTKQITSAMKMVSASKLRKTQNSIIKLKPYARKMNMILQNLCNAGNNNVSFFNEREEVNNVLIVIVSSNRGMCGTFNSAIIKATHNLIDEKFLEHLNAGKLSLMCIGKKNSEYFAKRKYKIDSIHNDLFDNLNYENASSIAKTIMDDFENKKFDKVIVVYNYFKNAAVQVIQTSQFLPFIPDFKKEEAENNHDYILEPEKQIVINELVPRTLKLKFYEYILNSYVSEHGARMTAMHKATDNATELLKDLKLSYNKVRQASITGEILEIVGGADALS
jgi:F-type H+-transporting ATPase subunit gamma